VSGTDFFQFIPNTDPHIHTHTHTHLNEQGCSDFPFDSPHKTYCVLNMKSLISVWNSGKYTR